MLFVRNDDGIIVHRPPDINIIFAVLSKKPKTNSHYRVHNILSPNNYQVVNAIRYTESGQSDAEAIAPWVGRFYAFPTGVAPARWRRAVQQKFDKGIERDATERTVVKPGVNLNRRTLPW